MQRYEVIDHTADLMVRAYGKDLKECYENLAYGMFDQTVDLNGVDPVEERSVDVTGLDEEDALYSFLSELLFIEDYENIILKEFHVKIDGFHITCSARGELLNRSKMKVRGEIKAVTFHMMEINKEIPSVTVLFDV